jgi:phosphate transport system permease protein
MAVTSDVSGASPLTRGGSTDRGDRIFSIMVTAAAACVPLLLIAIVILLLIDAMPAVQRYGAAFLAGSDWDPVAEKFGAAAYIYGTVVTAVLAVLIAGPIGVACAVYIAEYAPKWLAEPVSFLITLLAAIPSIIYGLWGFRILAPIMRAAIEPFL